MKDFEGKIIRFCPRCQEVILDDKKCNRCGNRRLLSFDKAIKQGFVIEIRVA